MKNKIILLILQLVLMQQVLFAQECDEFFGFEKVMLMRNDIQNELNLTEGQQNSKEKINSKYHPIFNIKFAEIGDEVQNLHRLSVSENRTNDEVKSVMRQLKLREDELFEINKNYEKEIKSILTPTQRIKYSYLKFQGKLRLKQQFKLYIKHI